jgi:hypothetical protein
MKLVRFRHPPSERAPIILPLIDDAARRSGRAISPGTRLDLMFLSLWLLASALAAIGIVIFVVYSYLPTIARG